MKGLLIAGVLALCLPAARAQSIGGSPFIAVHGKARTEVVPDIFPLSITLKDTNVDGAATQALIERYARQIMDLTQTMAMADRDVDISNLSVSPEYRYDDENDKQVFLGNTYERQIGLRFHSLADLRKAIDAMPKAEQVRLDTGAFESSWADELRRELLSKAVENARATADVMAESVGRRVGQVHNISNQGFNVRYVSSGEAMELDSIVVTGTRLNAPSPPVAMREGTIRLDQDVYIIYTLVD
jgi:uncharacterized protein YggE